MVLQKSFICLESYERTSRLVNLAKNQASMDELKLLALKFAARWNISSKH